MALLTYYRQFLDGFRRGTVSILQLVIEVPEMPGLHELGRSVSRPDAQRALAERVRDASPDCEHSLLFLRFEGVGRDRADALVGTLERLTGRLLGPAMLVPLGAAEAVLLLEYWSGFRSRQLGVLLELDMRRRMGPVPDFRMYMGVAEFRGSADLQDLLDRARQDGAPAPRHHSRITPA